MARPYSIDAETSVVAMPERQLQGPALALRPFLIKDGCVCHVTAV
jgi:hypothetical protein